jgi:hypothetical protein
VFAGSNQASFECALNDTYRPCLRYVTPFEETDAKLFVQQLGVGHTLDVYERFANFVPRQMVLLSNHDDPADYVNESSKAMADKLHQKLDLSDQRLFLTLRDFFRLSSMALGIENLSLLDLGYVYRHRRAGSNLTLASPLCYPATLALLQVWREILPEARKRLVETKLGEDFEDLVWDVLLSRGFGSELRLNGLALGYDAKQPLNHVTPVVFRFGEYFVSSLRHKSQGGLADEIKMLKARAKDLDVVILYRCPECCKAIDFAVFVPDGRDYPIQVSLSTLTAHSAGGKEPKLEELKRLGLQATNFLYITTSPEPHNGLVAGVARSDKKFARWKPLVSVILLVDARQLIGV